MLIVRPLVNMYVHTAPLVSISTMHVYISTVSRILVEHVNAVYISTHVRNVRNLGFCITAKPCNALCRMAILIRNYAQNLCYINQFYSVLYSCYRRVNQMIFFIPSKYRVLRIMMLLHQCTLMQKQSSESYQPHSMQWQQQELPFKIIIKTPIAIKRKVISLLVFRNKSFISKF